MTLPARARERRATIAVCAGVTLLAALLAFWWSTTNRYRLTGDEPHFLILASSLLRDGDVDVRNNFDEDAATGAIYGPIPDRHVVTRDGREYLRHPVAVSALLTLPFAAGGPTAARLLLCLLITPILGWACWRWLSGRAPPGDVALAVAGVLICPVVLFGSGQIYGDLLAGAIIVALAAWLWDTLARHPSESAPFSTEARSPRSWMLFALVAGLLPWLHMKYLATATLFGLFAAWQARRERPLAGNSTRNPSWLYAACGALFLVGPITFFSYQMATNGMPFFGQGQDMTGTPYLRTAEMFLGRHLDQSHGLFWHQPLFFPGLIALGWMVRKRHPLTIPWLLLYASLLVPSAVLQPLGRHPDRPVGLGRSSGSG